MENIQSSDIVQELLTADGYQQSGMWREAQAFLTNYNSVQANSEKMMSVSETIADQEIAGADCYVADLQGEQNVASDAIQQWQQGKIDQQTLSNTLQQCQGQSTVYNTEYSEFTQFETGLNNGLNQSASDCTQTESLDMQEFEQGTVFLAQQIGQMLA